ncbi:MAG: ABC transporter ATP-binding protein [Gemmataceae bacterium]|nr:ABC transporter ATP-binding protein [Gemmataceae bacterium]
MKNFLRALRYAWPYRVRLCVSFFFALLAAVLWGLNFTSIYPVLKLLHTDKSPHQWIDECISQTQKEIEEIEVVSEALTQKFRGLERKPITNFIEQQKRENTNSLVKVESKLVSARRQLNWYLVGKKYIYALLPPDSFKTLVYVLGLVMIGVLIKCVFEFFQESLVGSVVNLTLFDFRNKFYRNVVHLDVDQFGEQGTSELMARFTNEMEAVGTGIKTLFGKVVAEPLRALSCVIFAACISWQLTLVFFILVPVAAFILGKIGRMMKLATRKLLERMSSIYKILQETFQGIKVVKSYTMEPYERRKFRAATLDYYKRSMIVVNIDAAASPIIEVLGMAAVAAALLAGSYLVLNKETMLFGMRMSHQPLEPESLLQLYVLLAAVADPVRKLSSVFTKIQSGCAAADRIFHFMDKQPRVTPNTEGPRLVRSEYGLNLESSRNPRVTQDENVVGKPKTPLIEFRGVCFSYDPGRPILTNINLSIYEGETVAFLGHNGSGKSTLLGLIPRFYDPDHGTVLIQGEDLRKINLRSIRQRLGIVTQETVLFDDTIFNNIAYGTRGASREKVEAAAVHAHAQDFISRFPKGYETLVGEGGSKLSGGQKQRIALARAILRDPSILILDEFTSQSDPESEALIHQVMREFLKGRTSFVITHRLNTLEIADRIVVLDGGGIVAVGTQQELLKTSPHYQRLFEMHGRKISA